MVNWSAKDVRRFKKEARASQQDFCTLLGDREWDVIDSSEWTILRRKVGFGLYGPPSRKPSSSNRYTGYKENQLDAIEKVCDQLVEDYDFSNRSICFACIFVLGKIHDQRFAVPVFRAKRNAKNWWSCVYVDSDARKYSGWNDYLEKNTLPKCIYCYPTRGLYENDSDGDVCISFGTSPVCDFTSRVLDVTDEASQYASLASGFVGLAVICSVPVYAPIAAAAAVAGAVTGAYGATRSSYALYDRATHGQTIDLTDAEARGHWLSILASGFGLTQGRMLTSVTSAARAGDVTITLGGRIAFAVVQYGNLTIKGVSIAHNLVGMIEKAERDELTLLDTYQFTASLLFFAHTFAELKDAKTIIKEVQRDVIKSHRDVLSSKARKLFNKQTGRLRGPDEMRGNAKVVQQLNRIQNSRDLYEMMSDGNVDSRKIKLTPEGFKGKVTVNDDFLIFRPLDALETRFAALDAFLRTSTESSNNGGPRAPYCCLYHQLRDERRRRSYFD